MSTSLKVVSIAAVFCASLRRLGDGLAQARHPHALLAALAGDGGADAAAAGAARALARRGRRRAALSAAASTSSLVRRPSLPVPLIFDGIELMLEHDAAHRGRQGDSGVACIVAPAPAVAGSRGGSAGAGAGRPLRRRARRRRRRRPRSCAITAPTATVSPTLTSCSPITPATGEGTSTATLSVSRLAIGSSASTGVARLLQPFAERRLGDRFAQRRDFDFGRHVSSFSRLCACGACGAAMAERVGDRAPPARPAWRFARPVAGEAAAARPA